MVSIIIKCLVVRRKMGDYHGVWLPMPSPSDKYFQPSPSSLCALAAENRYTRLFITGAQIRFPFARNREMAVE